MKKTKTEVPGQFMLHIRSLGKIMLHLLSGSRNAALKTKRLQRPHYASRGQLTVQIATVKKEA
jgi:hypothetical protein